MPIQLTVGVTKFDENQVAVLKQIIDKLGRHALDSNGDTMKGHLKLKSETPATASSPGKQGTVTWDDTYVYVCVAEDTWKRSAIATW